MPNSDEEELPIEGRGRGAKKRAAHAVGELATKLSNLSDADMGQLPDYPDILEEINLARRTKGHGSRARQIRRLASVLRKHDEERLTIEKVLQGQAFNRHRPDTSHQHLEQLRNRLCDMETSKEALAELRTSHPELDAKKIARLAKSAMHHGDKRAAREIFRMLKKAAEAREAPKDTGEE